MSAGDTLRVAILDAIHAQHPILMESAERPAGAQFAQWQRGGQGHRVGISGVLDLDRLAFDVEISLSLALDTAAATVRGAADLLGEFLPPAAPSDAPEPPEAADGRTERSVICAHCGLMIERAGDNGKGWRHITSGFLGCEPDHTELAEP